MVRNWGALRLHWTTWLMVVLLVLLLGTFVASNFATWTRSEPARTADEFLEALRFGKLQEAAALLSDTLPKEKRDLRTAWGSKLSSWGPVTEVEPREEFEAPADLNHPQAAQARRLDYVLHGLYAKGSANVYVVPEKGGWRVADYIFN